MENQLRTEFRKTFNSTSSLEQFMLDNNKSYIKFLEAIIDENKFNLNIEKFTSEYKIKNTHT